MVITRYPDASLELVQELEGLPLAIQVAGRLLNAEAGKGFGIIELLNELRKGIRILDEPAPPDYADIKTQTTPIVAALLKKSTDLLNEYTRDCFAYLAPFAPKPATFDLDALKDIWEVDNPEPIVRILVDRGLLEPVENRYQIHALLVAHARSLHPQE